MKVVVIAPVHTYDDIRVFQKEARSLAMSGYDVVLIARSSSPLKFENIQVIPVPSYTNRFSRFAGLFHVFKLALKQKADIYHLHNPDTLPLAILLKFFSKKVIYDTHEDFLKCILIRDWIPRPLRLLIGCFVAVGERFVAHICDAAIGTQSNVIKRLGSKSILIENPPWSTGPIVDEAYKRAQSIQQISEFRLIYIGAFINEYRGLFTMIDAINQVNKRIHSRLWLLGHISKKDMSEAKNMPGWQYVDYLDYMPVSQAYAHVVCSDAGLLTFHDVADHREISPNKLYEYQLFGIPFIAASFTHWKEQLTDINSGIFVDPQDVNQIVNAIVWLSEQEAARKEMGERGQDFICKHYNWEMESVKLLSLYENILHPTKYSKSATDNFMS